ncbi:MAG: hypothetical protein K2I30_04575 [Clostridia bacterium]|nr:hypothetical protein [Clostridia bacterium]
MKNKQEFEKVKNEFKIRLYDTEVIKSIAELMQTGKFESYNDLLGYAISFGIEKIYLEFGKKRALTNPFEVDMPMEERLNLIDRKLAEARIMQEDMFILSNGLEILISTVYNTLRAEAAGEEVTPELIDSGFFSTLPEFYRVIKDTMIERSKKKTQKEKKKNV